MKVASRTGVRAALMALAMAGTACIDSNESLVIVQNQIPVASESGCLVSAAKSAEYRDHGVLDVALDKGYPYYLFPLLHNRLPMGSVMGGGTVDPNEVVISGYQIKIDPPPNIAVEWNPACPPRFDYPVTAIVPAGGMVSNIVKAIRECHYELLKQLFVDRKIDAKEDAIFRVTVKARGRHGGSDILSEPFTYPIHVCYGCMQQGYKGEFAAFDFPAIPACSMLTNNPFTGNPCNVAQDGIPVLCCARDAQGTQIECPGRPRAVMMPPAMP